MLVYQRVKGYLLPLGACHLHPWPPMDSRILLGCGSTSIISSVWIPRTTLGYLAVGVVGGLLLLRLFCERLLIWLRTFLFQDGCCHWMRMHVFMESWKKREKKTPHFSWNAIWSWKKSYWEKHCWGTTFGKTPFLQRWSFMICTGFWSVTICLGTIHYGSKSLIHSTATISTNTKPQRNLAKSFQHAHTSGFGLSPVSESPSPYLRA